jgi:hypothetical protein
VIRILLKLIRWTLGLAVFAVFLSAALCFALYNSTDDLAYDLKSAWRAVRIEFYNRDYIKTITQEEVRHIYQKSCYRKCHGEAAMITTVLSEAGWFQVVERMRVKEGVDISGREADVIIKYLEGTYPTSRSEFSFETRKKVHQAVWRNDMGANDIYTDVTYATPEYLRSVGALGLIEDYELNKYHVFIVGFTVHEGEVAVADLDKISQLRSPSGSASPAPPWKLRFQTADKHHYEAIIRFAKRGSPDIVTPETKWFELAIKGVGGPDVTRVFKWDLPIVYPEEVIHAPIAVKASPAKGAAGK